MSDLDADAMFGDALLRHRQGDVEAAECLYRNVLRRRPSHAGALQFLGVARLQRGDPRGAEELIARALAYEPLNPSAHANLAGALTAQGRVEEALICLERALAIRPDFVGALIDRGNALLELGHAGTALQAFQRALAIEPENCAALNACGNAHLETGEADRALLCFERALALEPSVHWLHTNRATALANLQRHEEALAACIVALKLHPTDAGAYHTRGDALFDLGRFEEAVEAYDRALALEPDRRRAWSNRGSALLRLRRFEAAIDSADRALACAPARARPNLRALAGACVTRGNALYELARFEEALASLERAIAIDPDLVEAHTNRGSLLYCLNRTSEALVSYERALAVRPEWAPAHLGRAMMLLRVGRLAEGWTEYEWRWRDTSSALWRDRRHTALPLWLGQEPIAGRTILLHAEQGYGDTLQFCRYAPLLVSLNARVILEVPASLKRLLSSLGDGIRVIDRSERPPDADFQCPLMSLPLALGTTLASIPGVVPYLSCDPDLVAQWRARLGPSSRLRVGLVWAGGFRAADPHSWSVNARRNIALEQLAPLAHPDIDFHSLQLDEPSASESPPSLQLIDHSAELHDFSDTAALIENLDLVITVDTASAHLAGALGKPVWILNRLDGCWRWLLEREDSPWYPSARLYRQSRPGEWRTVIERVREDLHRLRS